MKKYLCIALIKLVLFAVVATLMLIAVPAPAAPIVDTGLPTNTTAFYSGGNQSGWASEFTVNQAWTIDSISAHISHTGPVPYSMTWAIFNFNSSGGDVTPPASPLYSSIFLGPSGSYNDWYGPTGLNWSISAGSSYWVAVWGNNDPSFTLIGSIGTFADPSTALVKDAYWTGSAWSAVPLWNIAWQINGNPSIGVPEPATMLLLGLGLVGLAGFRRKFKK